MLKFSSALLIILVLGVEGNSLAVDDINLYCRIDYSYAQHKGKKHFDDYGIEKHYIIHMASGVVEEKGSPFLNTVIIGDKTFCWKDELREKISSDYGTPEKGDICINRFTGEFYNTYKPADMKGECIPEPEVKKRF